MYTNVPATTTITISCMSTEIDANTVVISTDIVVTTLLIRIGLRYVRSSAK